MSANFGRKFLFFLLLFISIGLRLNCHGEYCHNLKNDYIKNKKIIIIPHNTVYEKNIFVYNSKLILKGICVGSIISVDSEVVVKGEVKEDLIAIFSKVDLREGSIVKKDLMVLGGDLQKSPLCKIKGDYFFYSMTSPSYDKIKSFIVPQKQKKWFYFIFVRIIFWVLIMLSFYLLKKDSLKNTIGFIDNNIKKMIMLSPFLIFVYVILFLLFGFLSVSIIGISLLIIQFIIFFISLVYGKLLVSYFFANIIQRSCLPKFPLIIIFVCTVFFLESIRFIPHTGRIIILIINTLEFSIGFFYIFRKYLIMLDSSSSHMT